MVTKSFGKLHFNDLDPMRFEMLTMQIIYRMRRWEILDHTGVGGSDNGIDISAVELLENGKRVKHHFQCKRYEKLNKSQIRKIVKNYIINNPIAADYYYLVCGCNVSNSIINEFNNVCSEFKIEHCSLWSSSYIETLLYSDYHDILFAYFGINLSVERNNTFSAIRRNVALKNRMHSDFTKIDLNDIELNAIRYKGEYWRKFLYSEVLIRSVYDRKYPHNSMDLPGYYKAEIYNWYHNGLEVRAFPYAVNAVVKQFKMGADNDTKNDTEFEYIECRLETFGCIPFENIIEYDIKGDEYYNIPHLYCDYPCGEDPYEAIRYRIEGNGLIISEADIVKML